MSTTRPSSNPQRSSSQDDCGLWMRADLNPATDGPESPAPQRRGDDTPLSSGERPRVDAESLPSTSSLITHYYGVIGDDDVFMTPPPPAYCATEDDDFFMPASPLPSCDSVFMPPTPPPPSLPCTASSLPADDDGIFLPPPSPASCAAFSLESLSQKTQEGLDEPCGERQLTKAQNECDILTETCLTSQSLVDSSGGTEVVDLESKKDGWEDIVATNKEQEFTWEYWDSDEETDTQTPSSVDVSPTKGDLGRKTDVVTSFHSEDTNSTQPKPELDDMNPVDVANQTSLQGTMQKKTGELKNTKKDVAGAMRDGKANIDSRNPNYAMEKELGARRDSDLPPLEWPLISRGSSIEDRNWTVATSIVQGEQLLQRLQLVQERQNEGQVWPQGVVHAEVAKGAAGDRRVKRGTFGVEGMDCRHGTAEDVDTGQEVGETSRVENQDGGETEHERCEMKVSDDNRSDSRVPADVCPIETQETLPPQIHQSTSSKTSVEGVLCESAQGRQDLQRSGRVMLFEAYFQQDNTKGPARHRSRHPAGRDRTHPSVTARRHSLEAVSLESKLVSRSQSFRLQRPEASERERNTESQKCKGPVGGVLLSPYPQLDNSQWWKRSMDSVNLSAPASSTAGDTEERERGKKRRGLTVLKENPFFKLRPALALQPDVERDIRESREREEELRVQRCTLYGEAGRHRSEEEDPLTTSTLRAAADDRLHSQGKLARIWPPPSTKDQEVKVHKPGLHKAALWRRWEAGIANGERGTK